MFSSSHSARGFGLLVENFRPARRSFTRYRRDWD